MSTPKRTYLVVMDDSGEARAALRFAARRAAKTGGGLEVLAITASQDFVQWGGVQAAIEEEQQLRIEAEVAEALGELPGTEALRPGAILIRSGEPVALVRDLLGERDDIAALVLGTAPAGDPGPLVAAFTGSDSGKLPCPVMLIPGGISDERLEALS
ncbi:nucleotide-binding universal stress UspA family protein [Sphingomonas kaistensis]|uniref:Nucleotide-binding universal stress UspA family protein n=1 Tax=Sphingomonas kaistensis TaxID=298708 RepID=A0A7X6BGW0_9SPHN|nr:universal stress protein [Sphingomonas kaistensis]NJC05481.1 nucleotide-binding universal stress UspA family protein [Sphingomonas kaistensis]